MSVEHYETLLAEVYDWMQGGWEAKTQQNREHFAAIGLEPSAPGAGAIDLGAGTGYQSIPLAELGYAVTSVDPSASMLATLESHVGELAIETVTGLIDSHQGPPVELITCMGDTLAHLPSLGDVDQLFADCHRCLEPGGQLHLAYRDGTHVLEGDDRFLQIRSDGERNFTCYLEALGPDLMRVHDIVHTRDGDSFRQQISSYTKLRLAPDVVDRSLEAAGFGDITTTVDRGLVTTTAVALASPRA